VEAPRSGLGGQPGTLADVLACGPLSLPELFRCASEVATELWDLHRQNRAYGKLAASSVLMTESGAHLAPLQNWDDAAAEADTQAFGAMFYEMLVAEAPPASLGAADIRLRGALTGSPRLRPAAIKLALQCRQEGTALTMQQVATEIRLLGLLLREYQRNAASGQKAAAPRTPFLVQAAPPLEAAPMVGSQDAPPAAPDAGLPNEPAEAGIEESLPAGESGAALVIPLGPDSFGHPEPKPRAQPQPAGGKCPKCASPAIYVSRARSPFEAMLERWGVPLCRCHRCSHRYVVFAGFKIAKQLPPGMRRRHYKPRSPLE
jgi:hypothetical protein